MTEEEEFQRLLKVKPDVLQTLLLFKMYKTLQRIEKAQARSHAFARYMGPMTRRFKTEHTYQHATIAAGASGRVWYMHNPQPDLLVGIIVQVANDWFPNTFLEWSIDYDVKPVEYIIGQIDNPKEFERGIPFQDEVEWRAYNNDTSAHTFGVLCDGFFISKKLFNKIVR